MKKLVLTMVALVAMATTSFAQSEQWILTAFQAYRTVFLQSAIVCQVLLTVFQAL